MAPFNGLRTRFISAVNAFMAAGGQQSSAEDKTVVSKTSPTVWEYEMFRMEWERRAVLKALTGMLREDTRIQRANHVFAATGVRRGFDLKIGSSVSQAEASKAQKILEDFIRRIKMNSKLAPWARVLLRDGDLFWNPVVDWDKRQIMQVKSLPAITMQRNDDITGNFPDQKRAFQQIDPITLQPELELGLWQVNHVRWSYEEGARYGQSQYLGMLRSWKQLNMTEQDLVIRRRTRAAPKRVHIVGNKEHPSGEKELQEYIDRNHLDGSVKDIVTDYFMNGLGDVKDLNPDAMLDHIKDIIYLQEVYMIGSGVPLHILGFGQNVNRDIISDQKAQFEEDVQELRNIMEFGDSGAYSGIRAMFDLELALHEIDPSILDYNIVWFENNNETANDRVDRVIQLRSAQPMPLISQKTALRVIAKDLGFDNATAIEQEIDDIKDEAKYITQVMQPALKGAPNPEVPMEAPLTKEVSRQAGHVATDSVIVKDGRVFIAFDALEQETTGANEVDPMPKGTGTDISFPLHNNPQLGELEGQIRERIANHVGQVGSAFLEKHSKAIARLSDLNPSWRSTATDAVMIELDPYTHRLLKPISDSEHTHDDTSNSIHIPSSLNQILAKFDNEAKDAESTLRTQLYHIYLEIGKVARKHAAEQTNHPGITEKIVDHDFQVKIQHEVSQRIHGIMNTTKKMLAQAITQAVDEGSTADEIMQHAKSVTDMPQWRSDMIARTELANAYVMNLKQVYKDIGVQFVRWVAVLDKNTCPVCSANHGSVYAVDSIPQIPAHPNCRCTLVSSNGAD